MKEIIIIAIAAIISGLVIEIFYTYKDWSQIKYISNKVRYILMGWVSASLFCQAVILLYVLLKLIFNNTF